MGAAARAVLLLAAAVAVVVGGASAQLLEEFYDRTCPDVHRIVRRVLKKAHQEDPRIFASLTRLHFHDCFVQGCDASILLDNSTSIVDESTSLSSWRVTTHLLFVDRTSRSHQSPSIFSCRALFTPIRPHGARTDRVQCCMQSGGPRWRVPLGRRDGTTANLTAANNLPGPRDNLTTLQQKFAAVGLDVVTDLVALSGAHTFGRVQCQFVTDRLYNFSATGRPDPTLDAPASNLKFHEAARAPRRAHQHVVVPTAAATPTPPPPPPLFAGRLLNPNPSHASTAHGMLYPVATSPTTAANHRRAPAVTVGFPRAHAVAVPIAQPQQPLALTQSRSFPAATRAVVAGVSSRPEQHPRGVPIAPQAQPKANPVPVVTPSPQEINNSKGSERSKEDGTTVVINDRKANLLDSESGSLYALCQSWVHNGVPHESQPSIGTGAPILPRPLPASVVDSRISEKDNDAEKEDLEEEKNETGEYNASELLKQHVKRAKKICAGLQKERL
ncbi:hypothetical protein ABZP36_006633 [Zizania latifolia]